jgi:hypothetical protein
MDRAKLTTGQTLVYYGGWFLVINLLFIPWYRSGKFLDAGIGIDGFGAGFFGWGGSLLGIAAALLLYLKVSGRGGLDKWQFKSEYLVLLFTLVGFVFILVQIIRVHDQIRTGGLGVFLGVIFALLATAGMTLGAFMDSGLKLPQAKPAVGEPPPPPPPPPA